MKRILITLMLAAGCAIGSVSADDNVRAAQARLKTDGFYFGETNGTLDADTSAAISRYQIRNGLQITGQLDADTAKALGVAASSASTAPNAASWQRLRKSDRQFLDRLESTRPGRKAGVAAGAQKQSPNGGSAAPARAAEASTARSAPPTSAAAGGDQGPVLVLSRERLRDYVGAFVLAGLDPRVGAELEFFGEPVAYYDQGSMSREKIRADLHRYAQRWPERRFWLAGEVDVQPQADDRLRVTFPLRYQLRNGSKTSSGQVMKTLVLEVLGEDLQIVAVNERKLR